MAKEILLGMLNEEYRYLMNDEKEVEKKAILEEGETAEDKKENGEEEDEEDEDEEDAEEKKGIPLDDEEPGI